jgi:hypothetical protein
VEDLAAHGCEHRVCGHQNRVIVDHQKSPLIRIGVSMSSLQHAAGFRTTPSGRIAGSFSKPLGIRRATHPAQSARQPSRLETAMDNHPALAQGGPNVVLKVVTVYRRGAVLPAGQEGRENRPAMLGGQVITRTAS